jgi:hypothetical protein
LKSKGKPKKRSSTTQIGLAYEQLVQGVFQEILGQNHADTIAVEHDVVVKGESTFHQIDVRWRFKLAGITYTTVVQAKNCESRISQAAVLAFRAVLDDISGQPRGVMVTRVGYQRGALAVAKSHGIRLFTLRQAPIFHITMTTVGRATMRLDTANRLLYTDIIEPRIRRQTIEGRDAKLLRGVRARPDEIRVGSKTGKHSETLAQRVREWTDQMEAKGLTREMFKWTLAPDTYLRIAKDRRRYQVTSVAVDIEIEKTSLPPQPIFADVVDFILEDLETGETSRHSRPRRLT